MAAPRVCILRAPGTNCDRETAHAFSLCGGRAERVHLFRLLEKPSLLGAYQVLCLPGGFSYGDDIAAGAIFAQQLRGHLGEALGAFLSAEKLLLGICNGFQVLLKAGLLGKESDTSCPATSVPGQSSQEPASATLTWNDNGRYTDLWVRLRVRSPQNVFLRDIEEIELPVAHAEGKLLLRDPSMVADWQQQGRIALCYTGPSDTGAMRPGKGPPADDRLPYPWNPNGSTANIAGLSDRSGRVLGLMPHPERFIHATQHPQWSRQRLQGSGAGLKLFANAVEYFA